MTFTTEQITEFIEIYRRATGITLDREDAVEQATKLVLLVRALLTSTPVV